MTTGAGSNGILQSNCQRVSPVFEERGVETLDEMALIRNIVEHLPPLQRQLFRMKEIEGYDAGEIMQITGCTADNLRKNLSRARLKIRDTYMKLMKGARDEK